MEALDDAGVRFVVVGRPEEGLEVAVSRHPTNLGLLGSVLASVGARLGENPTGSAAGPKRAFGPLGTVWVSTQYGDLALLFGSAGESAYSIALDSSVERQIGGHLVRWVESVSEPGATSHGVNRGQMLGQRLISLVDVISELLGHESPPPEGDESGPTDCGETSAP